MTLKEKFEEVDRFTLIRESHNVKCEKIADDFAIDFAEWLLKNDLYSEILLKLSNTKELLEIFKKDKGL